MLIVIGGWAVSLVQILTGSGLNRLIINQVFRVEKRKKAESIDMTLLDRVWAALKRQNSARFDIVMMCRSRERLLITKASERIERELDISNLIRSQMSFGIVMKHLFTRSERFMIHRQKNPFVLSERVDRSDTDEYGAKQYFNEMQNQV